jgi:hypothetical protein
MPLNTRTKWEYCSLVGKRVSYLGADKLFEDKADAYATEHGAWDQLERDGWELTAVAPNKAGDLVHYFKRRLEE